MILFKYNIDIIIGKSYNSVGSNHYNIASPDQPMAGDAFDFGRGDR